MSWIRVEDRLPPEFDGVWAYDLNAGVVDAWRGLNMRWAAMDGDSDGAYLELEHVTHWQPIIKPEPPTR